MTRCPRLSEVEAAHDGRLDAAARASITQHQRDCASCRVAATALAALGPALAALPVPPSDALAVRRNRNRLLAAFNEDRGSIRGGVEDRQESIGGRFEHAPVARAPGRRGRRGLRVLGALALAAAAAGAVVIVRGRPAVAPPPAASVVGAAAVTVVPRSARWSRHDEGGLTVVRLEDGELDLHVAHGTTPHRLVVRLPDGEIDDLGTAFHVRVVAGRTSSVVVREGAVVVRRTGHAAIVVSAGERWFAEPAAPPVASAPPAKPQEPATVSAPPSSPGAVTRPSSSTSTARHPAPSAIAGEFRNAVSLLDSDRNAAAVIAFRAFLGRYRDDPRAEDASYLLVLALQRTGDATAMRAAARDYLRRYPSGFRRAHVEVLAEPSAP
jgi:hypothetical protein